MTERESYARCLYWREPEKIREGSRRFEKMATYVDDDHWFRRLLKCDECGQLYFYEFYECVDYDKSNDPQHRKWIPVASEDEALALLKNSSAELNAHSPCLRSDWPADKEEPDVFWVRDPRS